MDAVRVSALRQSLAGTGWPERAGAFAAALRGSVTRRSATGLLLVGTPRYEPWHLAAHLSDEAAYSGVPGLVPTLLRHTVPPGAPSHLACGLPRLGEARNGATVLLVAPAPADAPLLERLDDARRAGAVLLTLDDGDPELTALAHERLTVPEAEPEPFELVQHLVSSATSAVPPRSRLARLVERLTASPVVRW
ncbi:hypothetical protein TR51_22095 [Kitasatospora griseola]|uniref:Uncharacterized protein n=1 Tax=Kitasatospora griseola TaxID=2064 RepID=A0A0D0PU25_KITGR|nr:hypothetical protein [Kitasatospora griseola]KIQ63907.1 hypothetical protein TR51_22095 [Kitasatospora griseola]